MKINLFRILRSIRRQLIQRRWLIRLAATYLLTSIVLTLILMMFISKVVSTRIVNSTDASNRELLNQVNITLDYTLADLYSEFISLWRKDPATQSILLANTAAERIPPEADALMSERLTYAVNQADLVHSAYLISYPQNRVWSSLAKPMPISQMDQVLTDDFISSQPDFTNLLPEDLLIARQIQLHKGNSSERIDVLSFHFAKRDANGAITSLLLVNLDRNKLRSLILTHSDAGLILLVSPRGQLILQAGQEVDQSDFPALFKHPETAESILNSPALKGSVLAETKFGKSLVTWQRAEKMDFLIADIVPLDNLNLEANRVDRLIGSYFLITLLISLIFGLIAVRYLYKPLQMLLENFNKANLLTSADQKDEFSSLESIYHQLTSQSRNKTFNDLLSGRISDDAIKLYPNTKLSWIAIAIMPSHTSSFLPAVIEPLLETIRLKLNCPAVLRSEDLIVALPGFDTENPNNLNLELTILLNSLQESFSTELVAGIGNTVKKLSECRQSLRQALIAANQAQLLIGELIETKRIHPSELQVVNYHDLGLEATQEPAASLPEQAANYIREHLDDPNLSLDAVASGIHISNSYLRQLFKRERGQTINEFITNERIMKACHLLESTEMTARDISTAIGILDNRYFYTLFKKKTGSTADAFRQASREKRV